jgi:hypothetical protein
MMVNEAQYVQDILWTTFLHYDYVAVSIFSSLSHKSTHINMGPDFMTVLAGSIIYIHSYFNC